MAGVNITTTSAEVISTTEVGEIDILPDSMEMTWLMWYTTAAVCMIVLFAFHSFKVYQDFFTDERKSLNHRLNKPKLTQDYKFVQYLTLFVIFNYMMCAILFSAEMFNYNTLQSCIDTNNVGGWFMLLGKGCIYYLFMCRLDVCYGKSAYGYSKTLIRVVGWGNVAFGLLFEGFTTYMMARYWGWFADVDEFPNPCYPIVIPGDYTSPLFFSTTMMAWDFSMNVLALVLFLNPLRKVLKWKLPCNSNDAVEKPDSNLTRSMVYIAIKYTILTAFASLSTSFIWGFVFFFPDSYVVVSWDVVVNSCCIMLMTAYYPDEVWYERICCSCVFCCVLPCCGQYRLARMKAEKELMKSRTSGDTNETGGRATFDQSMASETGPTVDITTTHTTTAITAAPDQRELEIQPTVTEE
eukprot:1151116_1